MADGHEMGNPCGPVTPPPLTFRQRLERKGTDGGPSRRLPCSSDPAVTERAEASKEEINSLVI
jgi:hypothetical protein